MVKTRLWSLLATLALVFSVVVLAPPFVRTASAAAGIAVNPTSGPPGTTVTVTGAGFAANELNIALTFNAVLMQPLFSASAAGSWIKTFVVPAMPAATGNVVDATGLISSSSTTFDVTPGLAISPATGPVGTVVTVTGTGFQFGDAITVTFDGVPLATIPVAPVVSPAGSWVATFVVPATGGGPHTVDASGSTTSAASVPNRMFTTPNIALSPTTASAGTVVTVNAVGFQSGETGIQVLWDGVAVMTGITADGNGSWSATFVVPAAARGAHTVDAQGTTTTAAMVPNWTFTVTPEVKVTGSGSRPGETVTVTGTGFGAYETGIVVTWDGAAALTVGTASANGGWVGTLTIPNAYNGPHNINAYGDTTLAGTAPNAILSVGHSFNISPASGGVGASVTVNGSGFYANETGIQALFNGTAVGSGITAGANGTWSTTFTIPTMVRGSYLATAQGNTTTISQVPGKTFVLAPTVSISPDSGAAGTPVTLTGKGFGGGEPIAFTIDGIAVTSTPATVSAATNGNFSATIALPALAGGPHVIQAADRAASAQVAVTVTAVTVSPDNGNVGSVITISGAGYVAGSAITVTYDGAAVVTTPSPLAATSGGSFQATVTIPTSLHGQHVVAASDAAGRNAPATFTMEATPPAAPAPLSPPTGTRLGTFGAEKPAFYWGPVSDPSGVTYTLQVSRDPEFALPVVEKSSLTAASYQLAENEKIGRGFYYWRVKATDGASNESGWSQVFTLKIGILPVWMPMWMFIAFSVIGLGIVAGLVYLFGFSRKH